MDKNDKKRIMIGITTAETVSHETMQSIYNLYIPKDCETVLKIIHAYNVADGRNNLVNLMFSENCDYLFFVDNDVVLPQTALLNLYNMQWYISVGTYPRKEFATIKGQVKGENVWTTLYWHDEKNKEVFCPKFLPFAVLKENTITPVDCCGLGCALIKKELFQMIEQPWFFFAHEGDIHKDKDGAYCIGEDMYFCRKVIQKGIQIWAHGSVICGHVGKYVFRFPERKEEKESAS